MQTVGMNSAWLMATRTRKVEAATDRLAIVCIPLHLPSLMVEMLTSDCYFSVTKDCRPMRPYERADFT